MSMGLPRIPISIPYERKNQIQNGISMKTHENQSLSKEHQIVNGPRVAFLESSRSAARRGEPCRSRGSMSGLLFPAWDILPGPRERRLEL
jgi:hypothetical protein